MRAKRVDADWILSRQLRDGIREALDGGMGELRMDPKILMERIQAVVTQEVAHLEQSRVGLQQIQQKAEQRTEEFFIFREKHK